jgi:uncharacterized protein YbaP (TraB family)
LEQVIGANAWRILRWDLQVFPEEMLQKWSPWAAKSFYIKFRSELLAPKADWCMDCEILAAATAAKKNLVFLETLDNVLDAHVTGQNMVTRGTGDDVSAFLRGNPLAAVKENLSQIYRFAIRYKAGEVLSLEKTMKSDKEFYDNFIGARNEAWLPKLEGILVKNNVFIAVGAGHMTGPSSLIKMLESKGYKAKRWEP